MGQYHSYQMIQEELSSDSSRVENDIQMPDLQVSNIEEEDQESEKGQVEECWTKVNLQNILQNREDQKVLDDRHKKLREQRYQQRLNDMKQLKQRLRAKRRENKHISS